MLNRRKTRLGRLLLVLAEQTSQGSSLSRRCLLLLNLVLKGELSESVDILIRLQLMQLVLAAQIALGQPP